MILVAKAHKKPVIVHVHDYTPICPLAVMYDSSRKSVCRTRSICSARCIYQFEKNKSSSLRKAALSASLNLFAGIFSGKLIEPAEAVLCVSKAQRNVLINRFPPIRHKTRVIYNPLPDLSPLQINEEGFGYLGGLSLLKGFGVLYNALAILKDPSLKVYVTGLSTLNEKMVKAFGCVGMTMCKKLEYDKQDSLYRQIEGVIFPSIVPEPLPYVTAEAILRARILIASRIGGIPEQVKGCKGVFLFEAGNYFELAEILKYVKDLGKEKAIDLGFQNREVFVKNFSNEKTVTEFMNVINHVT
jgi:glycosyltransferase involved in cell wall biosynthesis